MSELVDLPETKPEASEDAARHLLTLFAGREDVHAWQWGESNG